MKVREFRHGDELLWLRMRKSLWPDCSDEMHAFEMREIASRAGRDTVFFVVDEKDTPRGFAEVSIRDRVDGSMSDEVAYLEGWYVEEEFRRQGLGAILVDHAAKWAISRGLTELASDTELENEGSIRAHHALGFRETFRLVHFLKKIS